MKKDESFLVSTNRLSEILGVSYSTVARVMSAVGIKPVFSTNRKTFWSLLEVKERLRSYSGALPVASIDPHRVRARRKPTNV